MSDAPPAPPETAAGAEATAPTESTEIPKEPSDPVVPPTLSQATPSKTAQPKRSKQPNCCQKGCTAIMKVFAHDAIYGSFVGPHPVSFLCCCAPCKACTRGCIRPYCVASVATKIMYFIMLGIVTLLACFFIIPWPDTVLSFDSTAIASFYPCQGDRMIKYEELNGGCNSHAGYYMVYRCFFAFATVMLTNSLIMMYLTSTKEDPHRAKIHHGFWFYKYAFLIVMLIMYFLFLNGNSDPEGVFEFICQIVGNLAHFLFSFVVITYIMDVLELWVIENRTNGSNWADCIYWTCTGLISLSSILMFIYICSDFTLKRTFNDPTNGTYPFDNCEPGTKDKSAPDWFHLALIIASFTLVVFLIVAMILKKHFQKRFPFIGWIQVAMLTLFNFSYLWSALYSSTHIHSRPRCNWGRYVFATGNHTHHKANLQEGSMDVYFRISGFYHGILVVLALLYYAFVHGPRTKTAPLSMVFDFFITPKSRIPVFPDEETQPSEFTDAISQRNVWDDEQDEVAQSWSQFYVMMAVGALSLMMTMTNFTNPWAWDKYNSSLYALWAKFLTGQAVVVLYIIILLVPFTKVFPEKDLPRRKVRRRVVRRKLPSGEIVEESVADLEQIPAGEGEIIEVIEEEDGSLVEVTSTEHHPKHCGCLM